MERKYPFTSDEFKEIYSRVPRLTVDLVIESHHGILLTLRKSDSYNNLWHLPGGTVYYKERLLNAVKRIAQEELGIQVEIMRLIDNLEYPDEEKARGFGHSVSAVYLCRPMNLNFKLDNSASKAEFFIDSPESIIPEQKGFLLYHGLLAS